MKHEPAGAALVAARVAEIPAASEIPLWQHPEWHDRFPWLAQGVTGRGGGEPPFDLGLFGSQPVGPVMDRWEHLRRATGMRRVIHSRQRHGVELRSHGAGEDTGFQLGAGHDGHLTRTPGILLTVSVADCVPVFVVDAQARAIALVHAGWRGLAGGIVERALERLRSWEAGEIWLHCGPAICGSCYEVGPEVHAAVNPDLPVPRKNSPIDLREAIVRRAAGLGVAPERMSVSAHCTRCGPGSFFSHRAGSSGRQMGVLGIRE